MIKALRHATPEWLEGRLLFLLGCSLAVFLLVVLSETFLHLFPLKEHHLYLGEASPVSGMYKADPDFAVTYESWEVFYSENKERLQPFLPFHEMHRGRRIWAFFGNSFVQAPGMLADLAREKVQHRRVFNLGQNEELFLRLAQIKILLEHGLVPERIFAALMPVDSWDSVPNPSRPFT